MPRFCLSCNKIPTFNTLGSSTALYCREHALPGMVNVKNKTCLSCNKQPSYGFPGKCREYCSNHKISGCVKDPLKKCENEDCKEVALFGISLRQRCEEHKNNEDILMTDRKCVKCGRLDILNRQDLCVTYCTFDKTHQYLKKRAKHKEKYIGDLLSRRITKVFDYKDEVIDGMCSNKRPDFGYDMGTHAVFIEVDENQHKSYGCRLEGGENRRMFGIFQSLGGKGCIFLRYNPDEFKDEKGLKVKLCNSKREKILIKWIEYSLISVPSAPEESLRVKYLFYDGWIEADMDYDNLQEKDVI